MKVTEVDAVNMCQLEEIKKLKDRFQEYEEEKRSHNIIIEVVQEANNEDLRSIIDNLFNDLGLNYTVE